MECPICKNKLGFNCGTCIECGYNYGNFKSELGVNYEYKKCKPLIGKKMDIFDSMSDEEFYRYMKGDIDINIEI